MTGNRNKKPDQVQQHDDVKEDLHGKESGPDWQLPKAKEVAPTATNFKKPSPKK